MPFELMLMAGVGILVGAPVIGMLLHNSLKPKPCEGLGPALNQILKNQEKTVEKIIATQYEIVETQRLILHYLDLMERRQKSD